MPALIRRGDVADCQNPIYQLRKDSKMKTKKLNYAEMGKTLTRAEMKQIMAGSGGTCQNDGDKCSSADHVNCCSGLVCANYTCQIATSPTI